MFKQILGAASPLDKLVLELEVVDSMSKKSEDVDVRCRGISRISFCFRWFAQRCRESSVVGGLYTVGICIILLLDDISIVVGEVTVLRVNCLCTSLRCTNIAVLSFMCTPGCSKLYVW